jgi:hypothetical protein
LRKRHNTTVEDPARWILHFLKSSRDSQGITALTLTRGTLLAGQTIPYGYGLSHVEYRGAATIAHSGSYGGYRTYELRFQNRISQWQRVAISQAQIRRFSVNVWRTF